MNRPLTVADTGIACELVPASELKTARETRALDALQTIGFALAIAEAQALALEALVQADGTCRYPEWRNRLVAQAKLVVDKIAAPALGIDGKAAA